MEHPRYNNVERFNPRLSSISSVDELEKYCRRFRRLATNQYLFRKIHGFTGLYNFLPFLSRLFAFYFKGKLDSGGRRKMFSVMALPPKLEPEEIMQHHYAACSQQAIVMMAVFEKEKYQLPESWISTSLCAGSQNQ